MRCAVSPATKINKNISSMPPAQPASSSSWNLTQQCTAVVRTGCYTRPILEPRMWQVAGCSHNSLHQPAPRSRLRAVSPAAHDEEEEAEEKEGRGAHASTPSPLSTVYTPDHLDQK